MAHHGSPSEIVISPVAPADWPAALRILFARFPEDEQSSRREATLRAVEAGKLSLDGLRWAWHNGMPVGAALAMEQPDGITLVWPPIVTCGADDIAVVESALLKEVTQQLDQSPAKLGQILFDPAELTDLASYTEHGFRHSTDLFFVARNLQEPFARCELRDLQPEPFDERVNLDRFAALIEATYQDTQDCAWLEGLRTGHEALASHKLSGHWRPELWRMYRVDGVDACGLLLNEHPDQDAVELVYFGVTPRFRGRGYGRILLSEALILAAGCGRSLLFAAVDVENHSANALYAEAGFVELARRTALFRFPGGLARE